MTRWNLIPKDWFDSTSLEEKCRSYGITNQLQREFDNLLYNIFHKPMSKLNADGKDFFPQMDFIEDANAYRVNVEIPGVDQKDVKISIQTNQLEIKGEKKEEKEQKDKNHFYSERSYGSFYRIASIPVDADPDKIEAKFNNGILSVILPKSAAKQNAIKKIEIKKE